METEYVLASTDPLRLFNFYPTLAAAEADNERANTEYGPADYRPMTHDDYVAAERLYWIGRPAVEITADTWMEMLEVLPPMRWIQETGYNSFLMIEMASGPYTCQYVRIGTGRDVKYYEKMVDAYDRSTWMPPQPTDEDQVLEDEKNHERRYNV
jgi:hypothetical protein